MSFTLSIHCKISGAVSVQFGRNCTETAPKLHHCRSRVIQFMLIYCGKAWHDGATICRGRPGIQQSIVCVGLNSLRNPQCTIRSAGSFAALRMRVQIYTIHVRVHKYTARLQLRVCVHRRATYIIASCLYAASNLCLEGVSRHVASRHVVSRRGTRRVLCRHDASQSDSCAVLPGRVASSRGSCDQQVAEGCGHA